jgi:hypothetical protein
MRDKDQTLLEQAYQSINEAPFKFNDANTFHDGGYDTGPEDVPQYGSTKSSSPKTYHPGTMNAFNKLMDMIEDHVDDMPPELLDKVVARLQEAKQVWESDIQHSDQEAYQDAAGGARKSKYKTVQKGMGKR